MTKILIIDDEESICWGLSQLCKQMSFESESVSSAEKGLELMQKSNFDVVITDIRLPGMDGLESIEKIHNTLGKIPVIVITAFGDLQTAITAIKQGAFEYIVKPFDLGKVKEVLRQAVSASKILQSSSVSEPDSFIVLDSGATELIGSSPLMQEVYKQIALATTTAVPVLITGESGTGKELTARAIHKFGPEPESPFVAVNIAALSPSLIESELFGHRKGAFTGADSDRVGLIEQANGGTLFLDEIAEIPVSLQVKLLRVLDLGEFTPVGSSESLKVNFRLISATHQDLLAQVNHGEFRHDLVYRLRAMEIQLPPLRQRKEDISELVDFFLAKLTNPRPAVSPDFIEALNTRVWPGNVRELQNVLARSVTLARGGVLIAEHIDESDDNPLPTLSSDIEIQNLVRQWTETNWNDGTEMPLYDRLIEVIEPAILPTSFELSGNQYSAAARRLGIHRTTLKKKLDKFAE